MERIYIGMGSNLAAPAEQLRSAVAALARLPRSVLVGVSGFYQSDSLLPGQPRYTNAVAALDSALALLELLDALQAIENEQGRERLERWGPRTLDLDIVLFGDRLIDEPRLKATGAKGVIKQGNNVQVVYGLHVKKMREAVETFL